MSKEEVIQEISNEIEKWIEELVEVEGVVEYVRGTSVAAIAVKFESGNGYWIRINKMAKITLD